MATHLDEEAQLAILKTWWKENARFVLITSVLFVVSVVGWHFWQEHRHNTLSDGANRYVAMIKSPDAADSQHQAEMLIQRHDGSVFATVARFKLVQLNVQKHAYDEAKRLLKHIIKEADSEQFQALARVRLARIMLATNESKAALELLNGISEKALPGWVDWVRGDIYQTQGDISKAGEAYRRANLALTDNPEATALITQQLMSLSK